MYTYKKYHIGKQVSFKTRSAYLNYLDERNIFPAKNVLFIDSSSYIPFITEKVQQDSSVVYAGSYINDSTSIKRSDVLAENTSCSSRMLNEILHNAGTKYFQDSDLFSEKKLSSYKLYHLTDGTRFNFNDNGKIKIILNYTSQAGTYYDNFYKKVLEIQKENSAKMEVFFVILDYVANR